MTNEDIFKNLIPDQVRRKLGQKGVLFKELRQVSRAPNQLIEEIYSSWRSGKLLIERNWNSIQNQPQKILYSNSSCLLPDDCLKIESSSKEKLWKVATWNVNSVRVRLPLLLDWLDKHNPDTVCLQETKVENKLFPSWEIQQAGYNSAFHGQSYYISSKGKKIESSMNGVAILSKHPITNVQYGFRDGYDRENARLMAATISGVRIINVYVPQGQTTESKQFGYKLDFFEKLIKEILPELNSNRALTIMGDFNVAPEEKDLSYPESMLNKVSFHPKEHENLRKIKNVGFSDIFREFDQRGGQYSWWDFRTRGFERGEGMRIDYILGNSVLTSSCQACIIDIEAREQDRPSDHAPVIAEFIL